MKNGQVNDLFLVIAGYRQELYHMNLTIYLLRETVVDFEDVILDRYLEGEACFVEIHPSVQLPFPCKAYVQANKAKPPKWQSWLQTAFDLDSQNLMNRSNSFVLLLKVENRIFAVTFGYGFNAVDGAKLEGDFGLKIVLNQVNPDDLRTINTRTVDRVSRQQSIHVSVGSPLAEFGINTDLDWIRAVSGSPISAQLGKLSGADSIRLKWDGTVSGLGDKCRDLLRIYGSEAYKRHFAFIDHLRPLKSDDLLVATLNEALVRLLQNRDRHRVAVAFPTIPNEAITTYKLRQRRTHYETPDLDIAEVYKFFDDNPGIHIDLDTIWIIGLDDEDNPRTQKAALRQYLAAEIEHDGQTYLLSLGQWFRADRNYMDQVRRRVASLTDLTQELALPAWLRGEQEGQYNDRVARERQWLKLDKTMFTFETSQEKIESCDILTEEKRLICVKSMTSSATLSHLFAQGSVSAVLFKRDERYSGELKRRYASQWPSANFDAGGRRPCIVYAIGTAKEGTLAEGLFFFSLINLVQHVDAIKVADFDVALCKIEKGAA